MQVDALVDHFTSFTNDPRQMPVVWHQSLLVFLQVRTSTWRCAHVQQLLETVRQSHPPCNCDAQGLTLLSAKTICSCCCTIICGTN